MQIRSTSLFRLLRKVKGRVVRSLTGPRKFKPRSGGDFAGYFRATDRRIDTIRFANWGSRPYEYAWVLDIVHELNVKNMRILDM